MGEDTNENQVNTSEKQVVRNEKGQIISGTPNPYGRPKGAVNFSTKWKIFIDKVAKQNGMTPDEIDEQLLAIGFKKAKEGDYNFYRDIHDRVYGRPVQHTDITTGGEKLTNDTLVDELTAKLNAIHKGASFGGNGKATSPLDTETQNQK